MPVPPSPPPKRRTRMVAAVGGTVVGGLVGIAGANLVQVRRVRRGAGGATSDLDHTAVVGTGDGAPLELVVIGDSAARGYGLDDPPSAFPQCTAVRLAEAVGRPVAVRCFATDGHTTADVIADQVPAALTAGPDAVVVSVGVNDAAAGTALADVEHRTADLLETLARRLPDAVVVLVPCPDLAAAPRVPRPLNQVLGWRCRRVAAAQARGAATVGTAVAPLPRPDPSAFGADGFHPAASAHAAMADVAAAALVDAAARRTAWISA